MAHAACHPPPYCLCHKLCFVYWRAALMPHTRGAACSRSTRQRYRCRSSRPRSGRAGALRGRPLQRLVSAPWFLPVLLALALGLYRCTSIVLWWDELSTLDIAERPVSNILATAHHVDAVHSFYYLFMHFWIAAFGTSVLAIRLPSLLAMCGATVCTAVIAERLFDRRVAVISATLFALIPGVARYATEARSYGFVVLGSAVAFLLLLRALDKSTRGRWAAYGAILAVTGALNLIALIAVAGHLVTVWLTARSRGRRSMLRPFLLVVVGVIVLESPIMIFGMMEASNQLGHLPPTSLVDAADDVAGDGLLHRVLGDRAAGPAGPADAPPQAWQR